MTDTDGPAEEAPDDEASESPQSTDEGAVKVDESALLHDPAQSPDDLGEPGRPLNSRSPFMWGLFGGLGALVALWIGLTVMRVSGVIVLVVVAMFLAVGLNPAVE